MKTRSGVSRAVLVGIFFIVPSCEEMQSAEVQSEAVEEQAAETMEGNRLSVPSVVRTNLGIEFVSVERRAVRDTLRLPARLELLPDARWEHRTMLQGRVELAVSQFAVVERSDVLYRLQSPAWIAHQQALAEAELGIERSRTRIESFAPLIEAHRTHEASLQESIEVWEKRVEQLESISDAGGGRRSELVSARASLASARAALSETLEQEAQIEYDRNEAEADLRSLLRRFELLLDEAALLTGQSREALMQDESDGIPVWRSINQIEGRAHDAGIVQMLGATNGAWVEANSLILTLTDPSRIRAHAEALQSDLQDLRNGQPAVIVRPGGVSDADSMDAELVIGPEADAVERTIDVYALPEELRAWARPGIAAELVISLGKRATTELAIPMPAVQRDGLTPVIFRRDPNDPDVVIRVEADLGESDGRWVEVLSGVREGDEIVTDGGFQLMLATSGQAQRGGHFHADGTFHEEDH